MDLHGFLFIFNMCTYSSGNFSRVVFLLGSEIVIEYSWPREFCVNETYLFLDWSNQNITIAGLPWARCLG